MDKLINKQIETVKIKTEHELTGSQLMELKNSNGDFYQAIYNAFKINYLNPGIIKAKEE